MKLICAANPKSRNGAVGRSLVKLQSLLDEVSSSVSILDLTAADFDDRLVRELTEAPDAVVIGVGGDGTHFSLVNVLYRLMDENRISSFPQYTLCPMGTGNDVAKSIEQKVGVHAMGAAVDVALNGTRRACDLGVIDDVRFLDMFSAGWDVRVLRLRDRLTRWFIARPNLSRCMHGYLIYALAAALAMIGRGRWSMTVTLDDEIELKGRYAGILINNGAVHAGEFILTPRADMFDGLLDVRLFKNRFTYAWAFFRGWRKWPKWVRGSGMTHYQCRSIKVIGEEPIPTQIDGEQSDLRQEFSITVEPRALTLCIPGEG